jgi:hypothetical protein
MCLKGHLASSGVIGVQPSALEALADLKAEFKAAFKLHPPAILRQVGLIGVQHFSLEASVDLIPLTVAEGRRRGWRYLH